MLIEKTLYSLNDVAVMPVTVSPIPSRSECNPCYSDTNMLPLFVSPMNNIVNDANVSCFIDAGVNIVTPRDDERIDYVLRKIRWESLWRKDLFVGMSLKEFTQYFIDNELEDSEFLVDPAQTKKVCVDLANGHMKCLIDACKYVKEQFGDKVIIMTGNIANPNTYEEYAKAGIDYIRIGIGTGSICTTAANSSIHYPMASLIDKCNTKKETVRAWIESSYDCEYKSVPKIVADGGFTNFDQIIKALALGADYCMCGKLFAQCIEACTEVVADKEFTFPEEENDFIRKSHNTIKKPYEKVEFILDMMKHGYNFQRDYYGMSTKRAQKEMGGAGNKTAEGITTKIPVKYTVAGWIDNFKSYLKSAMSYTGFTTIEEFIGGPDCNLISNNAFMAYFK